MTSHTTTTTHRYPARAKTAQHADEGDVFQTLLGERIRVRRDDGDGTIVIDYMDRELGQDEETVSRTVFAARAGFEGYRKISEGQIDGTLFGEYRQTPRCPDCGQFMATAWDSEGMPMALCQKLDCDCVMDATEVIDGGYFQEWA